MKKDSLLPKRCERLRKLRGNKTQKQMSVLLDVTEKTYRSWENGEYRKGHTEKVYPYPDSERLIKMSEIFHCSIDYLLCRSDCTSVDNHYISLKIGLSDDAINTLKTINFRANTQLGEFSSKCLSTLDYILKDGDTFEDFLSNLTLFIDNNYKTPIFWDPEKHCYIDTGYRYANGDIGVTFGYLTKDNKGNNGYSPLGVSIDILESHAMLKMQEIIKDWKDSHKKQS